MKKQVVFIAIALSSIVSGVAQSNKELFKINDKPVSVEEFKRVYEKNLDLVVDEDAKNIDKYLDLYINYKLKVNQAYALQLDTLPSYKRELEGYKQQLMTPYLQDQATVDALIKEAYERTINEIRASHILVRMKKGDTLAAYAKIMEARKRIEAGEDFVKVAKEVSQDPSVKFNGGDLGYFSAFKMVYAFEDNAYKTKLGALSQPFKTRFGYHIVKVTGKRKSKGQFEAAHILVRDLEAAGKAKIDKAAKELAAGADFAAVALKYSEDTGTAGQGGKLPKFGTGSMVEPFEQAVLGLSPSNPISKPFKTKYGWHIVQLIKEHPVASFQEEKRALEKKVKRSDRLNVSYTAVVDRLKKDYKLKVHKAGLKPFLTKSIGELSQAPLNDWIVAIEGKKIGQAKFFDQIKYRKGVDVKEAFEQFKNSELVRYFKDDLINKEPDFRNTLTEYKEGLLLFELMQQKIWKKSSNDTLGLQKYFTANKEKYAQKKLDEVKGTVISDYQKQLEEDWIKDLRASNSIKIKGRELKKLKKIYNQ